MFSADQALHGVDSLDWTMERRALMGDLAARVFYEDGWLSF